MDENPYDPPEHYAARRQSAKAPAIAVVGNICLLIVGASMIGVGLYSLSIRMLFGGMFWLGVGVVGSYYVVASWREPE